MRAVRPVGLPHPGDPKPHSKSSRRHDSRQFRSQSNLQSRAIIPARPIGRNQTRRLDRLRNTKQLRPFSLAQFDNLAQKTRLSRLVVQRVQVNLASLRLFLRSSTGPNRAFEPQSLGRVRDPVRIAEGPTAIDAATQRRHFGFRLRLVDKLQPIGGGSGQGHPLSGTWATWMAPDVMPTK